VSDERKTKKELVEELAALRERVAELEQAESSHVQAEELVRIFRASTPIGLFVIQDGDFQFVNENFRTITGSSPAQLIGTESRNLVLPEDRDKVRDDAIRMLKGERTSPYRYRIVLANGEIRWMLEGVASVQYQGRRAVLGHAMDVTELERAHEQLEEALEQERTVRHQLESEARRRIDFTRALVHELKTPLTPVLSSSELLYSELREEPWMSIAENIHRGAANLSNRIDELLDLARVEVGALRINPREFDALKSLRRIGRQMEVVITKAGQMLKLKLPSQLPPAWADGDRFWQIVQNLMINASKFTPEGGRITLRAKQDGDFLVVAIEDNGPGIPKEDHARLFLPYHRQLGDREHLSGLGLGLALCKYLVEMHGGRIWVDSVVGKGSTFAFTIPLATSEHLTDSTQKETANEGASDRG
jgi:PAS domain S-box-containing protein